MFPTPQAADLPTASLIIGGESGQGGGAAHPHIYPGTARVTKEVRLATPADVDTAVAAARAAAPAWRAMNGDKRRDLFFKLATLCEANAQALGQLVTAENGSISMAAPYMAYDAAQKFRYFGGWADKIQGRTVATWGGPAHDYVAYEPYGVIGAIIPWNGPLFAVTMVIAPALAAGNTVVIKSPELAPFSVMGLAALFAEAGFPAGVVNVVTGAGDVGAAMVAHPGIDKIQFVGSGATAKKVLTSAADTLKLCGLELGGKSAVIVFADADLQEAAKRGLSGAVSANGQGCVNGTRLLVERSIYEPYLQMLGAMAGHVKVGDPMDPTTTMGPVISDVALARILGVTTQAQTEGARLVSGGARLGGDHADGYFMGLTVLADVEQGSTLAREEVFGPVLAVTPFDSEDEAIAIANGTEYGLGAYIHTSNLARAHTMAAAMDAGMVQVNGSGEGMTPCVPFGGMKQSGYGRLGGEAGLHEFLRVKNVWMNLSRPVAA
ncbi:aldehyde dehydrogenase [Sphingomonas sp. SUN039]|uniref:aldehyde dehydrogenase family protein n=1 Tax=Sphingomonas sp. SUN039 TaxID=2937787 RepID=UPI0021643FA7|nr:aldehyde dehydrogenase family protein [Sphingomonas sp. SUN039]UVO55755.1 aldehyde dehydrogenase family protein [Sphingomonas sp. SUN039]